MNSRNQLPYYGWMIVALAALAMVATLPGRTVGLGLITESLISEFGMTRTEYARFNMIATLLGTAGALIAGPLTDRFGIRVTLSGTLILLGCLVMSMSQWVTAATVMAFLILTRTVGQSALSTISVTSVGKWFTTRLAIAMGVFSVIVAIGFSVAIVGAQTQIAIVGWRKVWMTIGLSILILGLLCVALARRGESSHQASEELGNGTVLTLREALLTPCFWVFAIGMALYGGLIASVSLFNESILQELGFGQETFRYAMAGLMSAGLLGNMIAAWSARRIGLPRVMAVSLAILTIVMLTYDRLQSDWQVITHAGIFGFCGGVFSVLFFTGFGQAFGHTHLGKIQGCAQALAVIASALGPWWLADVQQRLGSYFFAMTSAAPVFALVAICAWFTRIPSRQSL
ncbi:MFS transporter [Akkermansiaceae bacterium]|nr:MFS transporter [Verrucomicrobiota bacterium]MDB2639466.1 MFS transporter [Akkermansiaceae bacterium]MDB4340506.1 MFS transporter [Akkermansiaceae bacterium]MDB4771988.1 MFS transporter [Akkermansiaceae bacterium]